MTQYTELENEGSLLKPQPTIREVTNSVCCRCNGSRFKILLLFVVFVGLLILLGHSMGLQISMIKVNIITINGDEIIHTTSEQFLSIALDTSVIQEHWLHVNLSDPTLVQRTKVFSPGFLRVGGTMADKLIFRQNFTQGKNNVETVCGPMDGSQWAYEEVSTKEVLNNFTMTGFDWVRINNFAQDTKLKLLFDLNVLLRNGDKWNGSNTKELLQFSDEQSFPVSWQLGNEPNAFPHVFHTHISGKQLGEDFISLRELLKTFPSYSNATLAGPDVTRPKFLGDPSLKYLTEFLKTAKGVVDAVTWHQYYLNGREADMSDFLNPHILNLLYKQILAVTLAVSDVFNATTQRVPIWLSETGSAYGGGAPGLSNSFVASFMWLDKLGLAAQMGIDVVIRQSLIHGSYALLEEKTYTPLPDWWVSVLYKQLVGHKVLQTSSYTGSVRFYCHCTPVNASESSNGTATLFGMNLLGYSANVVVRNLPEPDVGSQRATYILTGGKNGTLSRRVLLNGELLRLNKDGSLPPFEPHLVNHSEIIEMPPYSIGFFVLHGISVPACKLIPVN